MIYVAICVCRRHALARRVILLGAAKCAGFEQATRGRVRQGEDRNPVERRPGAPPESIKGDAAARQFARRSRASFLRTESRGERVGRTRIPRRSSEPSCGTINYITGREGYNTFALLQ